MMPLQKGEYLTVHNAIYPFAYKYKIKLLFRIISVRVSS